MSDVPAVYLAGPIHGCADAEVKEWRARAKWLIEPYYEVIDPATWDFRGSEDEHVAEIVERDKTAISVSDRVLVNLWRLGAGTCMEILEAWNLEIPVVVIVPEGPVSPWIRYHANAVVGTLDEAVALLLAK